jgi:RimJ/RimL family protein N-acetyltransferase
MSASSADWPGLRSARLTCRPLRRPDAAAFRALVTRPEVGRMLFRFPPDLTLPQAEAFLDSVAWTGRLPFRLAIERDGLWQGWIGVSDDPEPEVFYALEPQVAGQGLAGEALAAFAAFLFARFPVPALTAGVFSDNPASARVLERCGFVLTGQDLHASAARPEPSPCLHYRLTRP